MESDSGTTVVPSDDQQPRRPRMIKTREVNSRFLSPISSPKTLQSPQLTDSPIHHKTTSSMNNTSQSFSVKQKLEDHPVRKSEEKTLLPLNRQKSCNQVRISENNNKSNKSFSLLSKSSNSTSVDAIVPGRISDDEMVATDCCNENFGSRQSRRKPGKEVLSRYLNVFSARHPKLTSNSDIQTPCSSDSSAKLNKLSLKDVALERASSVKGYRSPKSQWGSSFKGYGSPPPQWASSFNGYRSSTSQWALSPGRASPPLLIESNGEVMQLLSSNSPSIPSRVKEMRKLLDKGLRWLKNKKYSYGLLAPEAIKSESAHQLRLLHNSLVQWQYTNARVAVASKQITSKTESDLLYAWDSITKLQLSLLHKRLKLQRERLDLKLYHIIGTQIELLEVWKNLEAEHMPAVSRTKDCLHSIICRLPLIEGAKANLGSVSITLQNSVNLIASIELAVTSFFPSAEQIDSSILELAEVVAQEKLLLKESIELFEAVSMLEIQERSFRCDMIHLARLACESQQQQ